MARETALEVACPELACGEPKPVEVAADVCVEDAEVVSVGADALGPPEPADELLVTGESGCGLGAGVGCGTGGVSDRGRIGGGVSMAILSTVSDSTGGIPGDGSARADSGGVGGPETSSCASSPPDFTSLESNADTGSSADAADAA